MSRDIDVDYLRWLLKDYSLVILDGEKIIYSSTDSTIRPILHAVRDLGDKICGKILADRIVGKAVALIIANFPPRYVFGSIMSMGAKNVLSKRGIEYGYDELVEYIKTPSGDICPFERLVANIDDPPRALDLIAKKLNISGVKRAHDV